MSKIWRLNKTLIRCIALFYRYMMAFLERRVLLGAWRAKNWLLKLRLDTHENCLSRWNLVFKIFGVDVWSFNRWDDHMISDALFSWYAKIWRWNLKAQQLIFVFAVYIRCTPDFWDRKINFRCKISENVSF